MAQRILSQISYVKFTISHLVTIRINNTYLSKQKKEKKELPLQIKFIYCVTFEKNVYTDIL